MMEFERQKPITDTYRANWERIYAKKPKPAKCPPKKS